MPCTNDTVKMPMPTIIAELGINHGGSVKQAIEMAHAAADAGADLVKLQYYDPYRLTKFRAENSELDADAVAKMYTTLRRGHLTLDDIGDIRDAVVGRIPVFASVFDPLDVHKYVDRGFDIIKLSVEQFRRHGMQEALMAELGSGGITEAYVSINEDGAGLVSGIGDSPQITWMWCPKGYPVADNDFQLGMIPALASVFQNVGVSLHTPRVNPAVVAAVLGAAAVEVHFTTHAAQPEYDWSLRNFQLSILTRRIREALDVCRTEKQPCRAKAI